MAESNYKIEWKKWKDAFREAFNEFKKKKANDDGNYEKLTDDSYSGPMIHTELGIFPINETNLPSAVFNFWRGNTIGFILTERMGIAIMDTLGVEAFNVYTPYRFRIAIAIGFNEEDVKKRVEESIFQSLKKNEKTTISNGYHLLHKQYKFFAVIEDKIKTVLFGNTQEDVEKQINELKLKSDMKVYLSWKQSKN